MSATSPQGVEVGSKRPDYLTVGTYPQKNARRDPKAGGGEGGREHDRSTRRRLGLPGQGAADQRVSGVSRVRLPDRGLPSERGSSAAARDLRSDRARGLTAERG